MVVCAAAILKSVFATHTPCHGRVVVVFSASDGIKKTKLKTRSPVVLLGDRAGGRGAQLPEMQGIRPVHGS